MRHQPNTASQALRHVGGFTAIELMVVVSIVAVLAALAGPSFLLMMESWRVRDATESLRSTLMLARSEAIKHGGGVAIHKLSNTSSCTSPSSDQDWDCGWIICQDTNNNGTCNASEPVLQRIEAPGKVQVTRTGGGASIKLNRWGLVDGTWLGFSLVPYDKTTTHPGARGVCMSSGGRIRILLPEAIPCTG